MLATKTIADLLKEIDVIEDETPLPFDWDTTMYGLGEGINDDEENMEVFPDDSSDDVTFVGRETCGEGSLQSMEDDVGINDNDGGLCRSITATKKPVMCEIGYSESNTSEFWENLVALALDKAEEIEGGSVSCVDRAWGQVWENLTKCWDKEGEYWESFVQGDCEGYVIKNEDDQLVRRFNSRVEVFNFLRPSVELEEPTLGEKRNRKRKKVLDC
jgi:hypothetical protein